MKRILIALGVAGALTLTACDDGPKAGDLCNHQGATAKNSSLVCARNNHSTGPLVWRNR